jgi:hypothetical protein
MRWLKGGKPSIKAHMVSKPECLVYYPRVRWSKPEHDDLRNNLQWFIEQGEVVGYLPEEQTEFSPDDAPAPTAAVAVSRTLSASASARRHDSGLAGNFEELLAEFSHHRFETNMAIQRLQYRVADLEAFEDRMNSVRNARSRSPRLRR